MKLQHYLCLLLFCLPLLVYAQSDKTVTVSYERSAKGEVTFYSETQSHTPYTVSMTFSRLSNTTSSEGEIYDAVIHYGKTRLLTLRPSTENVPIGFSYRYTYKKGNSRLKTDTSFVYLFPLAQGKVVRVNKMVSLDNFIKEDIKEMREIVEKATIKKFNVISVVFLIELIVVAISAYPLFSIKGNIGIIIWLCLFAITLYTASKIEKFKKSHDIQTYKEILAFIDGKQLTHDETQQEIGKRNYQKIIFAFIAGVIALIICFVVIFICQHLTN